MPFGVRFENLPAGHLLARHAERHEWFLVGIHRAVGDRARDRRQVVNADRGQLAIAADAPMQVLLQLHDRDETRLVDRRQRHHRAGDKRPIARLVVDRFVDLHRESRRLRRVLRQTAFDAERARSARARPPTSNKSGRSASRSSRMTCCAPGRLERRSPIRSHKSCSLHLVLTQRMLDQRTTLRAAAALDVDDIFHVAADLVERFAQRLRSGTASPTAG